MRNTPTSKYVRWAESILSYYGARRGAGSTYHQEHGWLTPTAGPWTAVVVMPHDRSTPTVDAARAANVKVVSLSADPLCLMGLHGPLMVEHSALALILTGLLRELRLARERERRAKRKGAS